MNPAQEEVEFVTGKMFTEKKLAVSVVIFDSVMHDMKSFLFQASRFSGLCNFFDLIQHQTRPVEH